MSKEPPAVKLARLQQEADDARDAHEAYLEAVRHAANTQTVHNHPYHTLPTATREAQERAIDEIEPQAATLEPGPGDSATAGTSKESVAASLRASDAQQAVEDVTGDRTVSEQHKAEVARQERAARRSR